MRAYEILFETDNRTKIQKLQDVIDHPSTEDAVRAVARGRLELLLASQPEPALPASRINIPTNLTEDDLDRWQSNARTFGQIYEALGSLSPAPSQINFAQMGHQIKIVVPPPFMGLTKQQYYQKIAEAVPGLRSIKDSRYGDDSYVFLLSFI